MLGKQQWAADPLVLRQLSGHGEEFVVTVPHDDDSLREHGPRRLAELRDAQDRIGPSDEPPLDRRIACQRFQVCAHVCVSGRWAAATLRTS